MKVYEYESNKYNLFIKTTDALFPGLNKENILLFDTATTSFEAANGCIFLIGTAFVSNDKLKIRQLFSENVGEEILIIRDFLTFSNRFKTVLSYKGDSFDFQYILGRLRILYADCLFPALKEMDYNEIFQEFSTLKEKSFDLFNIVKPLKTPLGLSSTRLDYLQKILGQTVFKSISGENISCFYSRFLAENKLKSLKNIVLSEENAGFISDYTIKRADDDLAHLIIRENDHFLEDILANNCDNLEAILYLCRLSLPRNILSGDIPVELIIEKNDEVPEKIVFIYDTEKYLSKKITLNVKLYHKDLKLFYGDYKNYYYFPLEDMAVHKSVAEFAATSSRKKATKDTAFQKISGDFIKLPASFCSTDKNTKDRYQENYGSNDSYLPVNGQELNDSEFVKNLSYHILLENACNNIDSILI